MSSNVLCVEVGSVYIRYDNLESVLWSLATNWIKLISGYKIVSDRYTHFLITHKVSHRFMYLR